MNSTTRTILLLSALLLPLSAKADISRAQDRFTGETKYTYKSAFSERHHKFVLTPSKFIATASISKDAVPSYSVMILTSSASNRHGGGWRYLGVREMHWLADGVPVNLQKVQTWSDAQRGYVSEGFMQSMSREEMALLGAARSVEFRIGQDEFRLTSADIASLKELAATQF